jgi:hypothetical protein
MDYTRFKRCVAAEENEFQTLWSRVLFEGLTILGLVKKFSIFYGTQIFITMFTRAQQLSLF